MAEECSTTLAMPKHAPNLGLRWVHEPHIVDERTVLQRGDGQTKIKVNKRVT